MHPGRLHAEGETHVLAAALYRYGNLSYTQAIQHVAALDAEDGRQLAQSLLGSSGGTIFPCANWSMLNSPLM